MRLVRSTKTILVILLAATVTGCGANGPSGAPPTSPTRADNSPSVAPPQTPSASSEPTLSPTSTTPSTEWTVISARVAYQWSWPGGDPGASVSHTSSIPPVPQLTMIG